MGHFWSCPVSTSFYVRSSANGQLNDPPKFKLQLDYTVKKLGQLVPDSVRSFPWKKAESSGMQQLQVLGQKALKWSLIALFILNSSSDIIYSISRNKELLIPFGLFLGCLTADFLKETSQDFFHSKVYFPSKVLFISYDLSSDILTVEYSVLQDNGMTWHPVGISCFFILVRIIAVYCLGRQSLLLHTVNGGLMQMLWHWISSSQPEGDNRTNVILEDASATSSAPS